MTFKNISIILLIVFTTSRLFAQTPDKEVIESLIEEIAESSDDELDYTSLYEDLYYFAENPLNLNTATREDLEKFQFLSDFHIEDILEYHRTAGEMMSIYELQLLESFSLDDIKRILPFIIVEPRSEKQIPDFKRAFKYGSNNLFLRTQFILQEQKGYTDEPNIDKQYQGSKFKYYTRYQFDYKRKIKFGFVAEKDAGEAFFKKSQKQGFDYYNAHLQVNNIWKFKTVTLGDYQVRFGQGLIAWSGFSTGKSSYVMSVKKKYDGLRKYSSTDENKFMRGIGTTAKVGKFNITGFVSYKYIDGNLEEADTLTEEEQVVTSFQITGLHRNDGEIIDKHSVSEFIYGGNIKWKHPKLKLGASYIEYFFGAELNKTPSAYNQFEFQGNHGLNASIDYQTRFKNIYFFGEEAISMNGGYALLNSAMMKLAPQMSLAILQRYYTKDYQAYYAAGFAEQSKTSNENGVYFGTEIHPVRNWKISAYFDTYKFPWLKYRTYAPASGVDFFTQVDYSFNRYVNMYVKYKQESKHQNSSDDFTGVVPLQVTQKRQFRYHITYSLSNNLTLKNRLELSEFKDDSEEEKTGFVIYQDVNYKFDTFPLNFSMRVAFFDAEYDARIYAYENDILYGFSIPGYSGRGLRTYLTLKYTVIKNFIDVWIRFANTNYTDRDVIGSSYDEIQGNNKSEVKFQVRIKF